MFGLGAGLGHCGYCCHQPFHRPTLCYLFAFICSCPLALVEVERLNIGCSMVGIQGSKVVCCIGCAWQFQPMCWCHRAFHQPGVQHLLAVCTKFIMFCFVGRKFIVTAVDKECVAGFIHVGWGVSHALVDHHHHWHVHHYH